ncbi:MAG: hypothetical protein WC500_07155 [Candidatus Margulisiibacteriota bacterium]
MNKIKSKKKIGTNNWVVIIAIVSAVAAIISAFSAYGSYIATSNYYSLASRPYLKVDAVLRQEKSSKRYFAMTCLQSPLEIVGGHLIYTLKQGESAPIKKEAPIDSRSKIVMFPGQTYNFLTMFDYPIGNNCILNVSIKYKSLSGSNVYSYVYEGAYFSNDIDGKWFLQKVFAN